MAVREATIWFEPASSIGPRSTQETFVFQDPVVAAVIGLSGYSVNFIDTPGRPFGRFELVLEREIVANVVTVDVRFLLRDWSGTIDDQYEGRIDFVVIAELEQSSEVRDDLFITGMEFTQATQFFRSAGQEDNTLPLVSGKDTAIRVYVDYDDTSGLPAITSLSGSLEVVTAAGTFEVDAPLPITPRSNEEITRTEAGHTLNFVIPGDACRGALAVRCRVFDASTPSQRSPLVERTLVFIEASPVRVFGVGLSWSATAPSLPAPTRDDLEGQLGLARKLFPTPDVLINGFTTVNLTSTNVSDTTTGAAIFGAVLDLLWDMRGDSLDIYYGLVPAGADPMPVGGMDGRGRPGVAASFINPSMGNWYVAHELGHALGLKHAPTRGPNPPAGPDPDYPAYSPYPSGSIGEIGFDSATNTAFNPATTFDVMGYIASVWISPYHYLRLLEETLFANVGGGFFAHQEEAVLFLGLSIDRLQRVTRRPSFHYPAPTQASHAEHTCYTVELIDACSNTLTCLPLAEDDPCAAPCWPHIFRVALPFPSAARRLLVWKDKTLLYEECIPEPPRVSVHCALVPQGILVRWTVEDTNTRQCDLWSLVQYRDRDGTWRGLLPRTQEREALVPFSLVPGQPRIQLRVLATSGIATGVAMCESVIPDPRPPALFLDFTAIPGEPPIPVPGAVPVPLTRPGRPGLIRARLSDESGRTDSAPRLRWFDQDGRPIGQGATLDLRRLPRTVRHVSVLAASDRGVGVRRRTWRVKRDGGAVQLVPLDPAEGSYERPEDTRPGGKTQPDATTDETCDHDHPQKEA